MDSKPFWQSASFWGIVGLVASMLGKRYNVEIDQAGLATAGAAAVSAGVAFWGVFRRKDIHVVNPQ